MEWALYHHEERDDMRVLSGGDLWLLRRIYTHVANSIFSPQSLPCFLNPEVGDQKDTLPANCGIS